MLSPSSPFQSKNKKQKKTKKTPLYPIFLVMHAYSFILDGTLPPIDFLHIGYSTLGRLKMTMFSKSRRPSLSEILSLY